MNPDLERLLFEGESDALDFKQAQYLFAGAPDDVKSELLKDILAFANSWRRSEAFILIGVKEVKGSPAEVVGIADHLDDANLQQFVNSKTNAPVTFAYRTVQLQGKSIGVIQIQVQDRPRYLRSNFGKLLKDTVYVRRGSSTDVATLEEIAKMGQATAAQRALPRLEIHWADYDNRQLVTEIPVITSQTLPQYPRDKIADFDGERDVVFAARLPNRDYYRDLAVFAHAAALHRPVYMAVRNLGPVTATDVRVELTIPRQDGLSALDDSDYPDKPKAYFDAISSSIPNLRSINRSVYVSTLSHSFVAEARVEKVQPQKIEWIPDPFYLGGTVSGEFVFDAVIYADELPEPFKQQLKVEIRAEQNNALLERLIPANYIKLDSKGS